MSWAVDLFRRFTRGLKRESAGPQRHHVLLKTPLLLFRAALVRVHDSIETLKFKGEGLSDALSKARPGLHLCFQDVQQAHKKSCDWPLQSADIPVRVSTPRLGYHTRPSFIEADRTARCQVED